MNPVPMQCPLCAGMIQIDPAYAGQQVGCPLCQGVMVLPPPEFFGPPPAPYPLAEYPPEFPPQYPQEPPTNLPQLGCPVCGGAFQVSPQMVGQQVACPHCQNTVTIPDIFGGGYAAGMPPGIGAGPELPSSLDPPSDFTAGSGIPTGIAVTAAQQPALAEPSSQPPVDDRYPPAPRPKAQPVAEEPPETRTRGLDANLYPPGMTPKDAATQRMEKPPERAEPPVPPRDDRFPPRMGKSRDREASPRERPISEREQLYPPGFKPPQEAQTSPPQEQSLNVDDLLPPGAAAAGTLPSAVDQLLPPGASVATTAAEPAFTSLAQTVVEALLPPGAPADPTAMPTEQVALPDAPAPTPKPLPAAGPGRLVLPTPDGDYVTVENKEGVKTISTRGEEIEIRKLSPEERTRRRRVKNIVMFTLALLVLVVVIVIMTRK